MGGQRPLTGTLDDPDRWQFLREINVLFDQGVPPLTPQQRGQAACEQEDFPFFERTKADD